MAATLNWITAVDRFQPAALTVQAQALPPNDQGKLLWDAYFSREDVNSVDLDVLTTIDYRPTSDRREWNAPGRRIPVVTPSTKRISMVPIESNFAIDEYEMQRLMANNGGNEDTIRNEVMVSVPKRVDMIAMSCWRRVEVDSFAAWANGQIVQKNPESGTTFTMSFGFPSTRYLTAGTAWDNGAVNAYDLLQAWIVAAEDLVGTVEGAMMRLNVLNAILADAPNLQNSVKMTRAELQDRIEQDKGGPFELVVNEQSVDVFTDGGTAYTRTKIWPAGKIAAIPQGGTVGRVAIAPTVRAWQLAGEAGPDASINKNGVVVFPQVDANGRRVQFEAQLNALPIPEEQRLYVTATGIA